MSCSHHPGAELILQNASGKISGIHQLMLNMHMKVCHQCAQAQNQLEALGGQLLTRLEDSPLVNLNFDQLMTEVLKSGQPIETDHLDKDTGYQQIIEQILATGNATGLNWHWRTKKFAEIPLAVNDDIFESKLIYFKKGMKVPKHTHQKEERTLVLHGSFSDDAGVYQRGDYICRTSAHEHAPVAKSDCICLAITSAPLKFTGTFGPILNLFLN